MQITRQAEYAVRTVYYLARQESGVSIPTARIAKDQDIPTPFLAKIVLQLSAVGILHTSRGARGGVRLAKAPGDISLLEIVEAVDGPIEINDCVLDEACCQRTPTCPVRHAWTEARTQLVRHLARANFGQLVARGQEPLDPEI
jgi:Rrf2 family protein